MNYEIWSSILTLPMKDIILVWIMSLFSLYMCNSRAELYVDCITNNI